MVVVWLLEAETRVGGCRGAVEESAEYRRFMLLSSGVARPRRHCLLGARYGAPVVEIAPTVAPQQASSALAGGI
jgi:hypothetical protein